MSRPTSAGSAAQSRAGQSDEETAKALFAEYQQIKDPKTLASEQEIDVFMKDLMEVRSKRSQFIARVKKERSARVQLLFEQLNAATSGTLAHVNEVKVERPQIQAKGSHVIFLSSLALDPAHKDAFGLTIYLWSIKDGSVEFITDKWRDYQILGMSADATTIAYRGLEYALTLKERPSGRLIAVSNETPLLALAPPKKEIGRIVQSLSEASSLTADGSRAVFTAAVYWNDPNPMIGRVDGGAVVLFDKAAGECRALSKLTSGNLCFEPVVSGDGSTVVLLSVPVVFEAGSNDRESWGIYAVQTSDGKATKVPLPAGAAWDMSEYHKPRLPYSISADGKRLAYQAKVGKISQIYLFDRESGTLSLITAQPSGQGAAQYSEQPMISGSGRFIVFGSSAELIPGWKGHHTVLYDIANRTLSLVDHNDAGTFSNGASYEPTINHEGTLIAFLSNADDLAGAARERTSSTELYVYSTANKKCLSLVGSLSRARAR